MKHQTREWTLSAIYPVVPEKPAVGGGESVQWNVRTHTDGSLTERTIGLDVAYLFWEAHTNHDIPISPPASPVIAQADPGESFSPLTCDLSPGNSILLPVLGLGLHTEARTSFITYWLPSFLKHRHVALRFVSQAAYETAARLDIMPAPDVVTRQHVPRSTSPASCQTPLLLPSSILVFSFTKSILNSMELAVEMSENHTLHQEIHAASLCHFRNIAVGTEELKVSRDANQRCSTCDAAAIGGKPLQKCGVCQNVSYCSKACQKKDWPKHKPLCVRWDDTEIFRLWNIFVNNERLLPMLHAAFIHCFDLLRHPTLEQPFFGEVHVGIEPENLGDFVRICRDPTTDTKKMREMFQISGLSRVDLPTGNRSMNEAFQSAWRDAQARPYFQQYPTASYGVTRIVIPGIKNWFMGIHQIPAETFDMERPADMASCLQYINQHTRYDEKNQIMLRTKLRDIDVEVIKAAAFGSGTMAAQALRAKMATDPTYLVKNYRVVEKRPPTVPAVKR
ncbi:hypothetical protein FB451DRAFT_1491323 [Mycena latifolia]|nr:hypothetical protein FB451DRAFT_1491323 [Mycena latifolia]